MDHLAFRYANDAAAAGTASRSGIAITVFESGLGHQGMALSMNVAHLA